MGRLDWYRIEHTTDKQICNLSRPGSRNAVRYKLLDGLDWYRLEHVTGRQQRDWGKVVNYRTRLSDELQAETIHIHNLQCNRYIGYMNFNAVHHSDMIVSVDEEVVQSIIARTAGWAYDQVQGYWGYLYSSLGSTDWECQNTIAAIRQVIVMLSGRRSLVVTGLEIERIPGERIFNRSVNGQ